MNAAPKRLRFANGPRRPQYLSNRDADSLVLMVLTLSAEVAALRDRLDTHERLADDARLPSIDSVETFEPTEDVESARAIARRGLIERVTRPLLEDRNPPASENAALADGTVP